MTTTRSTSIVSFVSAARIERNDLVAHEEPLEIRIGGVAIAVVMRTPGHDEDLAIGFLATERVIQSIDDVVSARHCSTVVDPEAEDNVLRVILREGLDPPLERLRRNTYASSSCGICGKATIEAALATAGPIEQSRARAEASVLYGLPTTLRSEQRAFHATGGVHAAGLFDTRGALLCLREDVGRHNAVDKVIGAQLGSHASFDETILVVSGRVSFEIVQKAAAVGVPIVAGISAPTSLAIRYGERLGLTVIGFLRDETMNVYAHAERIQS